MSISLSDLLLIDLCQIIRATLTRCKYLIRLRHAFFLSRSANFAICAIGSPICSRPGMHCTTSWPALTISAAVSCRLYRRSNQARTSRYVRHTFCGCPSEADVEPGGTPLAYWSHPIRGRGSEEHESEDADLRAISSRHPPLCARRENSRRATRPLLAPRDPLLHTRHMPSYRSVAS